MFFFQDSVFDGTWLCRKFIKKRRHGEGKTTASMCVFTVYVRETVHTKLPLL